MARLEVAIQRGSALQLYEAMWGPIYEAVLNILGNTGVILPIGDPLHGQPNATTFKTVGDQQSSLAWSEAPNSFDTKLDLTDPDSFQGVAPVVSFNGTDEYAEVNSALITAYPFSFGAWFSFTAAGEQCLVELTDKDVTNVYYILWIADNKAAFRASNTSAVDCTGSVNRNDGAWHFAVGVGASATDRKIYVNGSQENTNATSVLYSGNVDRSGIARHGTSSPVRYMNGKMAGGPIAPFLTAKELTADEVLRLYEVGRRALAL